MWSGFWQKAGDWCVRALRRQRRGNLTSSCFKLKQRRAGAGMTAVLELLKKPAERRCVLQINWESRSQDCVLRWVSYYISANDSFVKLGHLRLMCCASRTKASVLHSCHFYWWIDSKVALYSKEHYSMIYFNFAISSPPSHDKNSNLHSYKFCWFQGMCVCF